VPVHRFDCASAGMTVAMTRSLIGIPLRAGRRGAGLALAATIGVVERGLSMAAQMANAVRKRDEPDLDFDGVEHRPEREPGRPPRRAVPPSPAPPAASAEPSAEEEPDHVSEEATLVEEVAEAGAEDGAGAQIHVAEPWDGYRQMTASDVVDRIRGADAAVLAAVELYELSARGRQTVLVAVRRELTRAARNQ
jgi:hypothetical protein